jgi:hypothetical protein
MQQDIFGVPGTKGQPLPNVPEVTAGAFAEYTRPISHGWTAAARLDFTYTDHSVAGYVAGGTVPNLGALSLLNARFAMRRANYEAAVYGRNLLNHVTRTYLERDVSFETPDRPRFSVNTPLTIGIALSAKF